MPGSDCVQSGEFDAAYTTRDVTISRRDEKQARQLSDEQTAQQNPGKPNQTKRISCNAGHNRPMNSSVRCPKIQLHPQYDPKTKRINNLAYLKRPSTTKRRCFPPHCSKASNYQISVHQGDTVLVKICLHLQRNCPQLSKPFHRIHNAAQNRFNFISIQKRIFEKRHFPDES